jgi:DNA-binding CsgD family transcriptional regulator
MLHPTYLIYLIAYFSAMAVCIVQSLRRKIIASQRHAILLAAIVFGNMAVWFVEKFIPWDFEFLSVSYLFGEVILLGLHWMMQGYVRLDLVPKPTQEPLRPAPVDIATMPMEEKILKILSCLNQGEILAAREREILELVLANKKRKEIADALCLSENTIKTYTRTLYGKLGVGSREELYALLVK